MRVADYDKDLRSFQEALKIPLVISRPIYISSCIRPYFSVKITVALKTHFILMHSHFFKFVCISFYSQREVDDLHLTILVNVKLYA